MSSYKKHILFSLIITLPFFQDVFYLSLAVISASMIDMDHHVRQKNLIIMTIAGIALTLILYLLNLPYLIGVFLVLMVLIFYISEHRGFSHSLIGTLILSLLLAFFVLGIFALLSNINADTKNYLILIPLILGIMVLNRKLILIFCFLVTLGIVFIPSSGFNFYYVFAAILLGSLSHIILDLFTPSGVELFNPISSKKFTKSAGSVLFILWIFAVLQQFG